MKKHVVDAQNSQVARMLLASHAGQAHSAASTAKILLNHQGDPFETGMPTGRSLRIHAKRRYLRALQRQHLREVLPEPPDSGESVHLVSNAKADFWTWVPYMLEWLGTADSLYCSTWTASRTNVVELLELIDAGKIAKGRTLFLTGTYFKRRESAVYNLLLTGLLERGCQYKCFENHAKILLLANAKAGLWLTAEGSANLTSNPRFEQTVLTNDRALYEFHAGWMDDVFAGRVEAPQWRRPKKIKP